MVIYEVELFKVFLLVLARFSGLIVSAPILGSQSFPAIGKVGLAALSAILVTPVVPALPGPLPSDPVILASWAAGELLIGLMMGFVMTLVFAAIQIAGEMMDMQTGFSLMNVFNPALETQFPIFGFYFFIVAVLYLLAMSGHLVMIRALAATFDKIPLGGFVAKPALFLEVSRWGSAMFSEGFLIAAPVTAAMLLAYVTMGILSRLVPQVHMFVVGFPLTIALGLLTAAFITGLFLKMLDGTFERMFRNVSQMINGMS